MVRMVVAWLIRAVHLVFVLAITATPFVTKRIELLLLHFVFVVGMMLHWYLNENTCVLTLLEAAVRGVPSDKTFVFSIVAPIYDFPLSMSQQRSAIWGVSICLALKSLKQILATLIKA